MWLKKARVWCWDKTSKTARQYCWLSSGFRWFHTYYSALFNISLFIQLWRQYKFHSFIITRFILYVGLQPLDSLHYIFFFNNTLQFFNVLLKKLSFCSFQYLFPDVIFSPFRRPVSSSKCHMWAGQEKSQELPVIGPAFLQTHDFLY